MPSLGADMEAGTLVEWLKRPGDAVTHGDIIAVVDTAKGAIEIEVFEDGIIDSVEVTPGRARGLRHNLGAAMGRIRQDRGAALADRDALRRSSCLRRSSRRGVPDGY